MKYVFLVVLISCFFGSPVTSWGGEESAEKEARIPEAPQEICQAASKCLLEFEKAIHDRKPAALKGLIASKAYWPEVGFVEGNGIDELIEFLIELEPPDDKGEKKVLGVILLKDLVLNAVAKASIKAQIDKGYYVIDTDVLIISGSSLKGIVSGIVVRSGESSKIVGRIHPEVMVKVVKACVKNETELNPSVATPPAGKPSESPEAREK